MSFFKVLLVRMENQVSQPTQPIQTRKVVSHRKKTLKRTFKLFSSNISTEDLLDESITVLYEIFNTYAPLSKITPSFRNFYTIGSGYGKVVLLMAQQHSFLKTVGIEQDSEKVVQANTALNKIRDESFRKRIEFFCISPFDVSLNYNNACWVFLSYGITNEMLHSMTEKLSSELKSGSILVSFKEIVSPNFKQLNYVTLPTTISMDSKVFVYSRV